MTTLRPNTGTTEAGQPSTTVNPSLDGSHSEPSAAANAQVKAMVDRTYHDVNHNVLLAGDPLAVRLRRSRAVKSAK